MKTRLQRLDDLLATYGGDQSRWPVAELPELSKLISENDEARRLLAQAQALDRLLDHAPNVAPARLEALSARILEQAARSPRVVVSRDGPAVRPPPASILRRHAAGVSALAASLVIGVLAGQNVMMQPAVSELATVVGIDSAADSAQLAATDEAYVGTDEDML